MNMDINDNFKNTSNYVYFIDTFKDLEEIFNEIFNKYKTGEESFISPDRFLYLYGLLNKKKQNNISEEEYKQMDNNLEKETKANLTDHTSKIDDVNGTMKLRDDLTFVLSYPNPFLKSKEYIMEINYLINVSFIEPENNDNKFKHWICSSDYLIEKIKKLGYEEAKIKDFKILGQSNKSDSCSNSPSEESINIFDLSHIDILVNNTIILKKQKFDLENIFTKSRRFLDPIFNLREINEYKKDLHIDKNINECDYECNTNYLFNLLFLEHCRSGRIYYYTYNIKSGLTFSILNYFEQKRRLHHLKYFHFNSEFLINILKHKRRYFAFKMAKLFNSKDELEAFFNSLKRDIVDLNYKNIFTELFKKFDYTYFIFDNVSNNIIYEKLFDLLLHPEIKIKHNIILIFFQLNVQIIYSLKYDNNNKKDIKYIKINNESTKEQFTPIEYYNDLLKHGGKINKYNDIETLFQENKCNLDFLIFITKIIQYSSYSEGKLFLDYNEMKFLNKLLLYIYIELSDINECCFEKIKFRTNKLKEIFNNSFISIITYNLNYARIFSQIKTKSNEGVYIEKQIIYHLLSNIFNYKRINISQIYCFNSEIKYLEDNNEFFFFQEKENSPLYDFGIIKIFKGILILKVYQIGINKSYNELQKLNKEKIIIDLLFFINKINKILKKKVQKFSFGIITTKDAYDANNGMINQNNNIIDNNFGNIIKEEDDNNYDYDNNIKEENDTEYKNYNVMKKFCIKENFEFIIFSPKDSKFYIEKGRDLEVIDFNEYYDDIFLNEVNKHYISSFDDKLDLIKEPPIPSDKIKNQINDIKSLLKQKNIIFEKINLIAKFIFGQSLNVDIDFGNLINDNYFLYQKSKNDIGKEAIFSGNKNINNIKVNKSKALYIYYISLKDKIWENTNKIMKFSIIIGKKTKRQLNDNDDANDGRKKKK